MIVPHSLRIVDSEECIMGIYSCTRIRCSFLTKVVVLFPYFNKCRKNVFQELRGWLAIFFLVSAIED